MTVHVVRWRVVVAAKKDQIQRSAGSWLFPTKVLDVILRRVFKGFFFGQEKQPLKWLLDA